MQTLKKIIINYWNLATTIIYKNNENYGDKRKYIIFVRRDVRANH